MARGLIAGMTDYSHQTFDDMLGDLDEWVKLLTNTVTYINEDMLKLKERKNSSVIDSNFGDYIQYVLKFYETSIKEIIELLRELPLQVEQHHVSRLAALARTASEVNNELGLLWHREYPMKPVFGSPEFEYAEDIYREARNMAADMLDLGNLCARLNDFVGKKSIVRNKGEGDNLQVISSKVFIVHGHDEEVKQSVARVLEKLDFVPIILHEQPNQGRTIIEKFVDYSDVAFAIVLLTPDDFGYPKSNTSEPKARARQNVIFELGYFLGKLGKERVVVIHRPDDNFEMPTDYDGVMYILYDQRGHWRFELAEELKTAGYKVDKNLL